MNRGYLMKKGKIIMILISLAIIVVFSGTVSAGNWTVNPGESIQAAVNSASSNDTIFVNDNNGSNYTYNENVVINKKLQVFAKTGGNVAIQSLNSSKPVITINSAADGSTIQGFIIKGATKTSGIYSSGTSNCKIIGNTFTNNNYGIWLINGQNNTISGNILANNTIYGININGLNNNLFQNNSFTGNQYGISISGGSGGIISENDFSNNKYGIYVNNINNSTIQNNTVKSSIFGLNLYKSQNIEVCENIITNCTSYGIYANGLYKALINNNTISGNVYGLSLSTISSDLEVSDNLIINGNYGIYSNSLNNSIIRNNTVAGNKYGLYSYRSQNNTISTNSIINNNIYGIYLYLSSANINFNRIAGNIRYGLYSGINSTVNATNNWWGSNNPLVSSSMGSDIFIGGGSVAHIPWLVLNSSAFPGVIGNNNSTITVDLTYNNEGADTSSKGNIPDNTPLNFTTNLGIIPAVAYTKNGRSIVTFNRDTAIYGTANVIVSLDKKSLQMNISIDTTAPTLTIDLPGGIYNSNKTVNLIASDNIDSNPVVYYSLNNGNTWFNKNNNVTLNLGPGKTDLKFFGCDSAGNTCINQTIIYIIDINSPTVNVNLPGGVYTTYQNITLTAEDNIDTNPSIYYTTDGSTPTTSSTQYTTPINIFKNYTILKFTAMDLAGNQAIFQTINYTIDLPIKNTNTQKVYSRIQDAINDASQLDIIQVNNGTYIENINLNKKLTLQGISGGNVIIKSLNQSKPVFFINSGGTGSTIKWFTVKDNTNSGTSGIYLGAQNCKIIENTLTNNYHGITLYNSNNNTLSGNILTNNQGVGIYLIHSDNNTLSKNNITNNNGDGICLVNYSTNNKIFGNAILNNKFDGIYLDFSDKNKIYVNNLTSNRFDGIEIWGSNNNIIYGNTVTSNTINGMGIYGSNGTSISGNNIKNNGALDGVGEDGTFNGIYLVDSSATINYNIIAGNLYHGIYNKGIGILNATNNFWNSNTPVVSSINGNDIYIAGGNVNYSYWCSYGNEISQTNLIQAAESIKTYIETNHELPISISISGIQVSMPQFLKLSTQAVLGIYNKTQNTSLNLGLGGYWCMPTEEKITNGVIVETEYISIANSTKSFMDSNGCAPNYMYYTSLGSLMGFESLVYMYSQILSYYQINQTLPGSINVTPWLAVKNPNATYNFRTNKVFSTIQEAIDDEGTLNGDTITLGKSTYTENVIITKTLAVEPLFTGIKVNAYSLNLPVFTIGIGGSGSFIENLIINGSTNSVGVLINNSSNNTVFGNNITGNGNGIYLNNSSGNNIIGNTISNNNLDGIFVQASFKNIFSTNTVKNNVNNGICLKNSDNNYIYSNTISSNAMNGIFFNNSSNNVTFNRISFNGNYGLYDVGNGTVSAQNNWWGSNNPLSSNSNSFIGIDGGIVNCDQWLVLNVTTSIDRSNRTVNSYNNIITADLSHNNHGDDTSENGDSLPDGIPVNFTTNMGTINSSVSTRKGKATATLSSSVTGMANFSAVLDRQSVSNSVNIININTLAIRNNRTNEGFTSIQSAINDTDTLNGDVIFLEAGTYTENVVINKTVIITSVSGYDVTVKALNEGKSVFIILESGNGSKIQGLQINGASNSYGVAISSASNCNIINNVITGNYRGIYFYASDNNTIYDNNIKNNYYGIAIYNSTFNIVSLNNITKSYYGLSLINSNNTAITENNLKDNWDGIHLYNSTCNNLSNNIVKGNWLGIYLHQSNTTNITGNLVTGNGGGINSYDSNSTIILGNNITDNWLADTSLVDPARMIMATTIYTCGPAALATVMKNMGINTTEAELANLAGTDETGTTMYGLVQAANYKGLNATGFRLNTDQLKTDYIVVLKINGKYHYNIIRNVTNNTVYLTDPNLGDIEMSLAKFNEVYTGYALVIANGTIQINATVMTEEEMRNIKAMRLVVDYMTISIPYLSWEWVQTSFYIPKIGIYWAPLKFWGWTVGWLPIPYFYWAKVTAWVIVPVVRYYVTTIPIGCHWEPDEIIEYVSYESNSEKTIIGHYGNFANSWLMEAVNTDIYDSFWHDQGISHRHFDWKEGIIIGGGIILAIPTDGLSLVALGKFGLSMGLMIWDNPGPFWYYHSFN